MCIKRGKSLGRERERTREMPDFIGLMLHLCKLLLPAAAELFDPPTNTMSKHFIMSTEFDENLSQ